MGSRYSKQVNAAQAKSKQFTAFMRRPWQSTVPLQKFWASAGDTRYVVDRDVSMHS